MPMRVIAKKRCCAMVEPPEKGERAILNPILSTKLKPTFFRSGSPSPRCAANARDRPYRAWGSPNWIKVRTATILR